MKIKLSNPKIYSIPTDSFDVINDPLKMWIKFTSYLTEEEKELINNINNMKVEDLTDDHLSKYSKIRNQLQIYAILPKYEDERCTDEEYDIVKNFFKNNSLKNFILSRFTEEERLNAYSEIDKLNSKELLKKFINSKRKSFNTLSEYEILVLCLANEYYEEIKNQEFSEYLISEKFKSDSNLVKSLVRDYGLHR